MLVQFAVENFLSFRERTVFSMVASDDAAHPEHTFDGGPAGVRLLKCAAVYGANGSGKSNLVKAIKFAADLILEGTKSGDPIGLSPFALDRETRTKPSRFEFVFVAEGTQYSYGFVLTRSQIVNEWLLVHDGSGERLFFERAPGENGGASICEFGESAPQDANRLQFLRFVAEGTRPNQLFLTEAVEHNVAELSPLMAWYRASLEVMFPDSMIDELAKTIVEHPRFRDFLGEFLKGAGTGITAISVHRSEIDLAQLGISGKRPSGVRELLQHVDPEGQELYVSESNGKAEVYRIRTQHTEPDGTVVDFPVDLESDGTKRLIHLSAPAYLAQSGEDGEKIFLIDELDRSLHPLLTRLFVERFFEAQTRAGKPAQLIFTTHDTHLLDLQLLRSDEIWFMEKDPAGASHIYSLSEFKKDQLAQLGPALQEGYLNGRFGAIPFIGDPSKLGLPPR